MSEDERVDLSTTVSVTVTEGPVAVLNERLFIEMVLRMGYGPRSSDERHAFSMLGGFRHSSRRRARRERLIRVAEAIAERVGHGDEPEPMRIVPSFVCVPISSAAEAREMFGTKGG